jgi:predicted enzyme related to lactoylglutathione lyase
LRRLEQEAGVTADTDTPSRTRTLIPKMVHLGVADADRAAGFYREVLGWQTERVEWRGHVRHYVLGDFAVRPCVTDEPGAPAVQLGFEVADVVEAARRVETAGGRVVTDEVEENGRFVAARDDQGVAIAFWNYGRVNPPPPGGWPPIGGLSYFAIQLPDLERGVDFYGRVLGWAFEDEGVPGYRHVADHVEPVAMGISGGADPAVALYFIVDDLESAAARVRDLGGETGEHAVTGPMATIECRDDEGNRFWIAVPAG